MSKQCSGKILRTLSGKDKKSLKYLRPPRNSKLSRLKIVSPTSQSQGKHRSTLLVSSLKSRSRRFSRIQTYSKKAFWLCQSSILANRELIKPVSRLLVIRGIKLRPRQPALNKDHPSHRVLWAHPVLTKQTDSRRSPKLEAPRSERSPFGSTELF